MAIGAHERRAIFELVESILMDESILKVIENHHNPYGESKLEMALAKAKYGKDVARSLGFDAIATFAIQIISDMAYPSYGEIGDELLLSVDPEYTRPVFGKRLAAKLLQGVNAEVVETVCTGVEYVLTREHHTAEEKIVLMMLYAQDCYEAMADQDSADEFIRLYKHSIIDETVASGVLTDCVIPDNDYEFREPIKFSEEELNARRAELKASYEYYTQHVDEIPEDFKKGWGDLDEKIIVSYFVALGKETL